VGADTSIWWNVVNKSKSICFVGDEGSFPLEKERLQGFFSEAAFPDAALKKQPRPSKRSALA
jgi:hypothetical protein